MSSSSVDYDYKFLTEPDDSLTCRICLKVAKDPKIHVDGDCGMLFCRECIEKWGMDKPCPNCRMEHPNIFDDARSKREIKALGVKCNNMERDCQWEGTVGTLEEHVGVCDFTLIPCPNECKDDDEILIEILMITRRDLQQHLIEKCPNRDYSCEHCDLKGTYATTLNHYDTCKKKIITCTNEECTMEMKRMKIKNHLSEECEHTVISCKYVSIGCNVKMKRKDMRAHEQDDDKAHLHKALDNMIKLEHYSQSLWERRPITFKLTQYQEKKDNDEVFYSSLFYTSPNGYHMKIGVNANGYRDDKGSQVSVFVNIIKGKYDDDLKWPFVGDVTIELLNQLENKKHYSRGLHIIPENNVTVDGTWGYSKYIPHFKLSLDSASDTQYLKNDTMYFKISVEVPSQKQWLECTPALNT